MDQNKAMIASDPTSLLPLRNPLEHLEGTMCGRE
jgi:hypothetical protein